MVERESGAAGEEVSFAGSIWMHSMPNARFASLAIIYDTAPLRQEFDAVRGVWPDSRI